MEDKSNNQQKMEDINKNNVFVSADDIKTEAIIKRTEKVVSALCLVTNLLSDSDPVKWGIRDKGVTLLSRLFSAGNQNIFNRAPALAQTIRLISETASLVEVAVLSRLISEMNASIIKKELYSLKNEIEDLNNPSDVSDEFLLSGLFDTNQSGDDYLALGNGGDEQSSGHTSGHKKQITNVRDIHDKGHFYKGQHNQATSAAKKTTGRRLKNFSGGNIQKDARKALIISLFKKNKELTIKDISLAISDCSEKTIQRELNGMLKDKIIKKEGEKRWSRYYLNRG